MSTAILKLIDREILGAVPGPNGKPHPYFDEIRESLQPLRAIRGELNARKQLVGLLGPARSGVSTLINSLVGSNVCPVGTGHETTARPAMVVYSRHPGIEVFYPENDLGTMETDEYLSLFKVFVDTIRGQLTEEEFQKATGKMERTSLSLSASALRASLAGPLHREPVLVIVKTPEWVLKTDQICFLDLPGLDGFRRNYHRNPHYYRLLQFVDFLILNQSTFASLDQSMILFLKNIIGDRTLPPMWLVHNLVDAKYWRDREVNEAELQRQLKATRSIILSEFQIPEKDLPINRINLGKAHEGIFSTREALFYESHFEDFEKNFMTTIHSRKLTELLARSENAGQSISPVSERLAADRTRDQERLRVVETLPDTVRNAEMQDKSMEVAFGQYGPVKASALLTGFRQKMQTRMDACLGDASIHCQQNSDRISARDANRFIEKMIRDMEAIFSGFSWSDDSEESRQLCHALDDLARSMESSYVRQVNDSLVKAGLEPLPPPPAWEPASLPPIQSLTFIWRPMRKIKRIMGFIPWPQSYTYSKFEDYVIYQLFGALIDQVVNKLNQWREALREDFQKRCQSDRKKHYLDALESVIDSLESESETREKCYEETGRVLDRLQSSLRSVSEATRSELSALRNKKWSAKL